MSTPPHSAPVITAALLEQRLRERFQPSQLEVIDESAAHAGHAGVQEMAAQGGNTGSGTHFRVRMATPAFDGLPRIARHRLVYDALRDYIDQGIHALALELR